jgi:dTDP-4-dehydrorhamnose 3,5-epimerase
MIDGVVVKDLVTHADERGYFRELIRASDPAFKDGFGQLSHSLVNPGVVKAWHGHSKQAQWTYVITGALQAVLYDARPTSPTAGNKLELLLGDQYPSRIYLLPVGVLHGYCCVAGPAHVLYVTSGEYDLADEVRVPHDDATIGYDWAQKIC